MNKLTAEKCREMFLHLFEDKRQDGITLKEDLYMQALEIALPILEQKDNEKSIIAEQLEAVRCSLALTMNQDAVISCAIERINLLTLRNLELSRSLVKKQEHGEDGWVGWVGGPQPVDDDLVVETKWSDGSLSCGKASKWRWEHQSLLSDKNIIAYRIIPERATNQNGEQ